MTRDQAIALALRRARGARARPGPDQRPFYVLELHPPPQMRRATVDYMVVRWLAQDDAPIGYASVRDGAWHEHETEGGHEVAEISLSNKGETEHGR